MNNYADDSTALARTLAELLVAPDGEPPAPPVGQEALLTYRDVVVDELRATAGALLRGTSPAVLSSPELAVWSPAHALQAALEDLPDASSKDLSLATTVSTDRGEGTSLWRRAAVSALTLEQYRDQLGALDGPVAWRVARDLALWCGAVPHLDRDLAQRLRQSPGPQSAPAEAVTTSHAGARAWSALTEPDSHARLHLAAAQLGAQTSDLRAGVVRLEPRMPPQLAPVNHLADLPTGTRQLTELLHARGANVSVVEVRAVLRAVAVGLDVTARALDHVGPSGSAGGADGRHGLASPETASARLRAATAALRPTLHSQMATLTAPAPVVLHLSTQLRTQLESAGKLLARLDASKAQPHVMASLVEALGRWAVPTAQLLRAASHGLQLAANAGTLLSPRADTRRGRDERLLWLPHQPGTADVHPVLRSVADARRELDRATPALHAVLNSGNTTSRPAVGRSPGAFAELQAALQARPAPSLPHAQRAAHPARPLERPSQTVRQH